MKKIGTKDYKEYITWASKNTSNRIYPMSIAEGFQTGDIYVNDGDEVLAVFFWHYCGFGFISGTPSKSFLDEISRLKGDRRLVIITNDESVYSYYQGRSYDIGERIEFEWRGDNDPLSVKEGFSIEPITSANISKIKGRIVPSFSWESPEQFLSNGFGYVAVKDGYICAVAFSAVSSEEVDIGLETYEGYRNNGLAASLASKMCVHTISIGKRPVWSCASTNEGSIRTALKTGFVMIRENKMIKVIE